MLNPKIMHRPFWMPLKVFNASQMLKMGLESMLTNIYAKNTLSNPINIRSLLNEGLICQIHVLDDPYCLSLLQRVFKECLEGARDIR